MSAKPWWKSAVVYQIYPRSFADGNADGIGDLTGLREHLDHIAWLGVDAVWLSPIFPSPMRDFGYDVADYCNVDPVFGTLADVDALVAEAHRRNLRVLLDWVPGHTSSDHPWFLDARSSTTSAHRDWYVWRDPRPDGSPPNNWVTPWLRERPTWTLDETTGQYWLHSFLPDQPDLNWENPEVVAAMHDTLRFWLDRGIDGFRADVVHNIGKDPTLADVDPSKASVPHCALNHDPRTFEHLRGIRAVLEEYPGDRMMVGEVFLLDTNLIPSYYVGGRGLHLAFNFPPMFLPWTADAWRGALEDAARLFEPEDAWPTWVLSNHDWPRHRTRLRSEARARAAALLLLTLRGTPFLYMGEELGLEDAEVEPDRVVDPGGRDGCRAPLPWTAAPDHGWPTPPWLPHPPDSERKSVATQREQGDSMLHLYRRILAARRASPALSRGDLHLCPQLPPEVLGYRRIEEEDERIVLVNFSPASVRLESFIGTRVALSTTAADTDRIFDGRLEPDEALVLLP
jgi:alpha-glucosidase